MRKNYIASIDNHLADFHSQGENFGKNIDETITQLEHVISTAQDEIVQLRTLRNVVSRFTWPDYETPAMPKVSTLPANEQSEDDAKLEKQLAGLLEESGQVDETQAGETQSPA